MGILIVLVLCGDAAAIASIRQEDRAVAQRPAPSPTSTTTAPPSPVLFRDEFSDTTAFLAGEDEGYVVTIDGRLRQRFKKDLDTYRSVPEHLPERMRIEQAQDVSVAVEAEMLLGEPDTWFGVFCRFNGLGTDLYRGKVAPNGGWSIDRSSIGDRYRSLTLLSGLAPSVGPGVHRIRMDCTGSGVVNIHLFIDGEEVGIGIDSDGLGSGNVGIAAGSTSGEVVFDNLVVTELS